MTFREGKMKPNDRLQAPKLLEVLGVLALVALAAPARAEEVSVAALKSRLEGAYVLEAWHRKGEVLQPPAVKARAVLIHGRIMFIAHDRSQDANRTTIARCGTYALEPGKYSYGFEKYSVVTQTPDRTYITDTLPGEDMRVFAASMADSELRLKAVDGPQEMRVTADRLSCFDGEQTRVYRREGK
jgi:hypothetical protein